MVQLNVKHQEFKNGALQHMLHLYPLHGADLKTWVDADPGLVCDCF